MNRINRIPVALISVFALVACSSGSDLSSSDDPENTQGVESVAVAIDADINKDPIKASSNQSYQKPGASVRFDHNYDGATEVGEQEQIQLSFVEQYAAGTLTISLSADEGLGIDSSLTQSYSLTADSALVMDLTLSAASEGKYYLTIFADVEDGNGRREKRVFGLALYVGDVAEKTSTEMEMKEGFRGDRMMMLPAEETISN